MLRLLRRVEARHALLGVALTQTFLVSGLVFGWPSLSVIFKGEGQFGQLCTNSSEPSSGANPTNHSSAFHVECSEQETQFVFIFQAGFFSQFASRLLMGILLDRYGPRVTALLGASCVILGCVLFAVSENTASSSPTVNAFIPAHLLIGFGGPGCHFSNFHLSNLFPARKNTIMSTQSAIFSTSGLVFYFFQLAYDASGVSHKTLFLSFAGLLVCFFGVTYRIQPRRAYKLGDRVRFSVARWEFVLMDSSPAARTDATASEVGDTSDKIPLRLHRQDSDGEESLSSSPESSSPPASPRLSAIALEQRDSEGGGDSAARGLLALEPPPMTDHHHQSQPSGAFGENAGLALSSSFSSPTADLVKQNVATPLVSAEPTPKLPPPLRFQYYRSLTFKQQAFTLPYIAITVFLSVTVLQMQFYLGTSRTQLEDKGDTDHVYNGIYNILGAINFIFIPISGYILDGHGGYPVSVLVTLVCALLFNVLNAVVNPLPAQIPLFLLWSFMRFITFSSFFGFIPDLFGFVNFGKLAGLASLISAAFGLLAIPLATMCISTLERQFWQTHIVFAVVMLLEMVLPLYFWRLYRRDAALLALRSSG
ncbi:hypothetical protein CAOG_04147 [Capsaspora owczarzaki ATCC 30864]|nr:hypothetical protein CAOG_04147 [Capsaspora owczarzaki ATCC 30864]|eukprot:XP_004347972.2 hypothetical protein CAOG_04147 [Capsaspora owczarzaki ATCC 30864]